MWQCCAGQKEGSRGSGRGGCVCPPPPDETPSAAEIKCTCRMLDTLIERCSCCDSRFPWGGKDVRWSAPLETGIYRLCMHMNL